MRFAFSCFLALGLAACLADNPATTPGDDSTAGDPIPGDPMPGDPIAPAGDPISCALFHNLAAFAPTSERYKTKYDDERLTQRIMYKGQDTGETFGAPVALRITAFEGLPDYPATPGTVYDLSTLDPSTGPGFLVKFDLACDNQGRFCAVEMVGYTGQATVSSIDWTTPIGSTFAGSLSAIEFRQVHYDANDLPVEVAGGCTFNLTAFEWTGVVSEGGG